MNNNNNRTKNKNIINSRNNQYSAVYYCRRQELLRQRDEYTEACYQSHDKDLIKCYENLIQTIDKKLDTMDKTTSSHMIGRPTATRQVQD
jgi:hypothetical protein